MKKEESNVLCNLLPAYQPKHVRQKLYLNFGNPLFHTDRSPKKSLEINLNNDTDNLKDKLTDIKEYLTDDIKSVQPVFRGEKLEIDAVTAGLGLGVISYKDFNHSQTPYATVERISHTNLLKPGIGFLGIKITM